MSRPPPFTSARARVPLRPDGSLRVGLVADTHSRPDARGLELLRSLCPDVLLHAGDIGDRAVLEAFGAIAPVHAVRGNIDERATDLPDGLTLELTHGGATQLTIFLTHVALAGPRVRADAARRARAAKASLIVCGHSHVPFAGQERGLTVFNPGSIGPRRFTLPILFGVMEVAPAGVSLRHVDCETGRRWEP
ncbi:MAG: metallophosphoesterase family protein [Myxococcaceae bacterium]|jgi:putative phosphoesterase|nr:metallophosphoesterase family protein [Myxococcaceae bacterium]MCA3014965.1 metallophosphoesterase family protein [Myxococcaceae bacterium]